MDAVELHRRTVERWVALVRGAEGADWRSSTPCTDWDVRALVNHVTGEERWVVPLLEGRTIEDVGDAFDGDLLDGDPLGRALRAARGAADAFAEPGAGDRTVALSSGPTAASEYARQLAADHLVHGWDLAVATGQDPGLPADLVEAVAHWFADWEDAYRRAGAVRGRVPLAADAEPGDRLLAAFGRDPGWCA